MKGAQPSWLRNAGILPAIRLSKTNPRRNEIKRIVVRTPTWVGDAVMSVPALRELRRLMPRAHITLASPPGAADIFIDADFVDDVLIQKPTSLASAINNSREWRRRQFDLALLFQNSFGAAATAFLARVPYRIGYATDRRRALLTTSVPLPEWKNERHESFYYLNLVSELARTVLNTAPPANLAPRFDLTVSEERKRKARELLIQHGATAGKPLVIISPGSINSRAKRWPAERFAALSDHLHKSGMEVALIGSPGELGVSESVQRDAGWPLIELTGKTSVAEAIAVISLADGLITNDTGPAHIGAALGIPTVVIFGPTNPLTTYPFGANAEMIRHPPDCAPCMLRDCPIDHRCMTAISPDEVFERAQALMANRTIQVSG